MDHPKLPQDCWSWTVASSPTLEAELQRIREEIDETFPYAAEQQGHSIVTRSTIAGPPCDAYVRRCGCNICHICLHPKFAHSARAQAQEFGRLTDEQWRALQQETPWIKQWPNRRRR